MTIEFKIEKERYERETKVHINETDHLTMKGKIVVDMINRWGIVAAIPDGEDSSGRAKLRLATPQELVNRSLEIADILFKEFEFRGILVQAPDFEMIELAKQNILEEENNQKELRN